MARISIVKEKAICRMIAAGYKQNAICKAVGLSPDTVRLYTNRYKAKKQSRLKFPFFGETLRTQEDIF